MKRICVLTLFFFEISLAQATAILDIVPSSTSPVVIAPYANAYLTYTVKNNTLRTLTNIWIDPGYENPAAGVSFYVNNNQCGLLSPGGSCSFVVNMQVLYQSVLASLTPRVCTYNGTVCSVPILSNRVPVIASPTLPNQKFPLPYAGTFYPLYFSGPGQWLEPDASMPFNRVSAIFLAFAHTYPQGNGAILTYESGQPDQAGRIARLSQTARNMNPGIKILISLGWGKNDWGYINTDYINRANLFVPSVIQFIRANNLDGIDIDDEEIGGNTGVISQSNFDGVIANLRNALNNASLQDGKPYYLTITPAGNNSQPGGIDGTQIDAQNLNSFNLINIQTYFGEEGGFGELFLNHLLAMGYPSNQIANGINVEEMSPEIPDFQGLAGLFIWNMTKDSTNNYFYTIEVANLVKYNLP